MTTNNAVDSLLDGTSGTGSFAGTITPTITSPKILTSIIDVNNNTILSFNPISGAINSIQIQNSSTGIDLSLNAIGSDTNISMDISGKGTGGVNIFGSTNGSSASSGVVGELITNTVLSSPLSLTNLTVANLTSINLTAGDWNVFGNVTFIIGGTCTLIQAAINTISATFPTENFYNLISNSAGLTNTGFSVPILPLTISTTTTVYLVVESAFSSSTVAAIGTIYARRVR